MSLHLNLSSFPVQARRGHLSIFQFFNFSIFTWFNAQLIYPLAAAVIDALTLLNTIFPMVQHTAAITRIRLLPFLPFLSYVVTLLALPVVNALVQVLTITTAGNIPHLLFHHSTTIQSALLTLATATSLLTSLTIAPFASTSSTTTLASTSLTAVTLSTLTASLLGQLVTLLAPFAALRVGSSFR